MCFSGSQEEITLVYVVLVDNCRKNLFQINVQKNVNEYYVTICVYLAL